MVLLDFSITPLGKGESVSSYVARCVEVVAASGLDYRLHAMATTVEGELDQVLAVVAVGAAVEGGLVDPEAGLAPDVQIPDDLSSVLDLDVGAFLSAAAVAAAAVRPGPFWGKPGLPGGGNRQAHLAFLDGASWPLGL